MIRPALLFTDHAVLQADEPVPVWGSTDAAALTVSFAGHEVAASVESGRFAAQLPAMAACTRGELTFATEKETLVLTDVVVGEVWLAGGQSNMEHPVFCSEYDEGDVEDDDDLRIITVPRRTAEEEVSYGWFFEPVVVRDQPWARVTKENALHFTAIGYFYGRYLRHHLGVPVGIVGCNWGGTPIETWIREEYLTTPLTRRNVELYNETIRDMDMDGYLARYREREAKRREIVLHAPDQVAAVREKGLTWFLKYAHAGFPFEGETGPRNPTSPFTLRRTMVDRVAPYAIHGVIWHQGESNARFVPDMKEWYTALLQCLFADWRDAFRKPELPFYLVQCAVYGEDEDSGRQDIRFAQQAITQIDPHCATVVSLDLGERDVIHPRHKKPMGERLAKTVLAMEYAQDSCFGSPALTGVVWEDGCAVCAFDHAEALTTSDGGAASGFTAFADGKQVDVEAEICGNRVRIRCGNADAVGYGSRGCYQYVNVINENGWPMFPFLAKKER